MSRGDAVQEQPTLEQEVAKFTSFAAEDGEVKQEVTTSAEEREAFARNDEIDKQAAAAALLSSKKTLPAAAKEAKAAEADPPAAKTEEKPRRLEDYKDDETLTAAEARRMMTAAVSSRVSEVKRSQRNEMQQLRDRLGRLESGGLTRQDASGTKPPTTDGVPDPTKYQYGELDVKFIEDRTRYTVQQELKTERQKDREAQQRDADARKSKEVAQRRDALTEKGVDKYPDFNEVVLDNMWSSDNPDGWPLSDTMGELVLENPEVGADIVHHLASDLKEARRVYGLTASQQAAYFGRLEARFTSSTSTDGATGQPAKPAALAAKVTQITPPPKERARGGSAKEPAADTIDFKSFERMAGYN